MRGTAPPPLVPEMPTETESTTAVAATADGGESEGRASSGVQPDGGESEGRASSGVQPDGGERRALPDRSFDAPLVPDCS